MAQGKAYELSENREQHTAVSNSPGKLLIRELRLHLNMP